MRTRVLVLTAALGLAAFAASKPDSAATTPPEETPSEDVTQTRRAELQPKIEEFLNKIAPPGTEAGLPRWDHGFCPQITGITADQAETIRTTVLEVGRTAGVPLAGEHCSPNLFIVVTPDPQKLLHDFEESNPAFASGAAPTESVREFAARSGQVKVWYNTSTKAAYVPAPLIAQYFPVTMPIISQAYVIVDAARLTGVSPQQLADYVAMVSLVALKPSPQSADTQSILTLFDGPPHTALTGMTDWDRALLKSLYGTGHPGQQRDQLASDMVAQLVPDPIANIVITAKQEKLSKLERQLDQAEYDFYTAYNKVNTEPEYGMNCSVDTGPRGLHAGASPRHQCTPQYVLTAIWNSSGWAPHWGETIYAKTPVYRKHVLEVVEAHPELIKMLEDYVTLTNHYLTVRKEKFERSWIVFD